MYILEREFGSLNISWCYNAKMIAFYLRYLIILTSQIYICIYICLYIYIDRQILYYIYSNYDWSCLPGINGWVVFLWYFVTSLQLSLHLNFSIPVANNGLIFIFAIWGLIWTHLALKFFCASNLPWIYNIHIY